MCLFHEVYRNKLLLSTRNEHTKLTNKEGLHTTTSHRILHTKGS
jgi:hypothetical protein